MSDFQFGKGRKTKRVPEAQSEKAKAENKKRFMLKCLSGGFGRGSREAPKVTLAPISFLKGKDNE